MAPAASGILVVVVTALPYTLANFQRGHLALALIDGASSGAMLLGYRVGELRMTPPIGSLLLRRLHGDRDRLGVLGFDLVADLDQLQLCRVGHVEVHFLFRPA